jgi:hypothetical protein
MTRQLVLMVTLLVLMAHGPSGAAPPGKPYVPQYRPTARWYGDMSGQDHSYARREPGGLGLSLSQPNSVQPTRVRVVLREEIDDAIGEHRTVVESLSWSSSIRDLYYLNKDGSRVAAGAGGSGSGSYSEEQLLGDRQPPRPEEIEGLLRMVQEAQAQVQEAEREQAEAEEEQANARSKARTAAPPAEIRQAIQHYYDAGRELRRRQAAGQESQELSARVEQAREALRVAREKYAQQIVQRYVPRMQQLTELLQDPKASEAEKAKASEELSRIADESSRALQALNEGDQAVEDLESARDRLAEANTQLESAKRSLRMHEAQLYEAQNRRSRRASATVQYREDATSGKRTVSVDFRVDDDKLREFPINVMTLRLVGFGTLLGVPTTETVKASLPRVHGISFRGQTEMANPDDTVTIRVADQGQAGSPGLAGGGEWSVTATFTRVPVKQQFLVRGQVLHRIRIPKDDKDRNFIADSDTSGSLEGGILVAGRVKVEAWLVDPTAVILPNHPPDLVGSTRDDARFEVGLPSVQGKRLRLRFAYHNAEAQLTEYNTLEIPTDQILSAAGPAVLTDIMRDTTGFFRFENSPQQYAIGGETRGAAVKREDGQTVLEFVGLNSILVNSFVLQTPYLNQNLQQGLLVARVKTPAARLLAARPDFVPEETVRARLGLGAGAPPEEIETDVKVRGTVVCFPTVVTMALGGLGLVPGLQDKAKNADQVRELMQAVYDSHARRSRRPGPVRRPKPPWVFPFPDDPEQFKTAVDQAFQNVLVRASRGQFDVNDMHWDWAWINRNKAARDYVNWPFVDAGTSDETKQWLISLEGGGDYLPLTTSTGDEFRNVDQWLFFQDFSWRPWQAAEIVRDYLHDNYGTDRIKVSIVGGKDKNPFDAAQKVVNVLGGGGTGAVSIDHRDSNKKQGGHIVTLVGAVIDNTGEIIRLIVHDPYGDQTRNPSVEGYYNPADMDDKSKYDKDRDGSWGAYAPYASEINSFSGTLYGKYWLSFEQPAPSVQKVRERLLPSELPSGSIPTPSP